MMAKCDVCAREAMEVYSIDEFGMCSQCLASGRIDELPPFRACAGSARVNGNGSAPLTHLRAGAQAQHLES